METPRDMNNTPTIDNRWNEEDQGTIDRGTEVYVLALLIFLWLTPDPPLLTLNRDHSDPILLSLASPFSDDPAVDASRSVLPPKAAGNRIWEIFLPSNPEPIRPTLLGS